MFGNTQRFYGMGVLIDTFDNDGRCVCFPFPVLVRSGAHHDFSLIDCTRAAVCIRTLCSRLTTAKRTSIIITVKDPRVRLLVDFVCARRRRRCEPHSSRRLAGTRNALELGGCSATLRNVGESTMRVVYDLDFTVRVFIRPYEAAEEKLCMEATDLEIPTGYHFGFTAATGDLADYHDVTSFTVKNLKGA